MYSSITASRSASLAPLRHGNAVCEELLLELHLVLEGESVRCVEAVTAHAEREPLALPFDLGEPDRSPASLGLDLEEPAADIRLEPSNDLLRRLVPRLLDFVCARGPRTHGISRLGRGASLA
jgi:hypothetical protein